MSLLFPLFRRLMQVIRLADVYAKDNCLVTHYSHRSCLGLNSGFQSVFFPSETLQQYGPTQLHTAETNLLELPNAKPALSWCISIDRRAQCYLRATGEGRMRGFARVKAARKLYNLGIHHTADALVRNMYKVPIYTYYWAGTPQVLNSCMRAPGEGLLSCFCRGSTVCMHGAG